MADYIPRTLTYTDASGQEHWLGEDQIGQATAPTVVLGEPGMGKTALMAKLGDRPGFHYVTARGLLRRTPDLAADEVLVIDALDEVAAARDEDPVHQVLARLVALGSPRFVLSCRAADWRGAIARHDITEDYRQPPLELRLTPLTRQNALDYLTATLGEAKAKAVIDELERRSLESLYGNPLMLILVARQAQTGPLPPTRAELLDQSCRLLGAEQNALHGRSTLANLSPEVALSAAGAAFAALLLTGSEAVTRDPPSTRLPSDLHLAELAELPDAGALDTVLRSNLFRPLSGEADRHVPLHRAVAEFLGARWLAARIDAVSLRRVLGLMTLNGGVPASLRGLHAWLAHFSTQAAAAVIEVDPYGVLRYGDADHLSPANGRRLLDALGRLASQNPWFRSGDWARHSAGGLVQPALLPDIQRLLRAPDTSFQLRSILLDAVQGSSIAQTLAPDLWVMVGPQSGHRFHFAERSAAADVLIGMRDPNHDWPRLVEDLHGLPDEDDRRLAIELITDVGPEQFDASLVVRAVLAFLGLLPDAAQPLEPIDTIGPLHLLALKMSADQSQAVLDGLVGRVPSKKGLEWEVRYALTDFVDLLIARRLEAGTPEPLSLLAWLRLARSRESRSGDWQKPINQFLRDNNNVRRAIQHHVFLVETDHEHVWGRFWRLSEIDAGFRPTPDDVAALLASPALSDRSRPEVREAWRDIVRLAARPEGVPDSVLAAAERYAQGDGELESYLRALVDPPVPEWQLKDEARKRADSEAREIRWATHRTDFAANIEKVRVGELGWIVPPARAYFGRFNDMDDALSPPDRIGAWLGEALVEPVLSGLEAVLHRQDLPGAQTIGESYAQSRRWNVIEPILAAVCERARLDKGLGDLPDDVLLSARLGLVYEHVEEKFGAPQVEALLDTALRSRPGLYERYARMLVEPQLEARSSHVRGLYQLTRPKGADPIITQLAIEWLAKFAHQDLSAEHELVGYLVRVGAWDALRQVTQARRAAGFEDDEQRLAWLATASLVDFQAARTDLDVAAKTHPSLLWLIRNRGWPDRSADWSPQYGEPARLRWIVETFRERWPSVSHPTGSSTGDQNDWDATEFLSSVIRRLAADTSDAAVAALVALRDAPVDGYTTLLKNASVEQWQAKLEAEFQPANLDQVFNVVRVLPPRTTSDLQAITLDVLDRYQARLRGDDVGRVKLFYGPDGPLDENTCRDRLAMQLADQMPFGLELVPERQMPEGRRADLVVALGGLQLPIEAKGQWNRQLWTAADQQLDAFYGKDWRAQGFGIYLVFWFGAAMPRPRHLQAPPAPMTPPATAKALKVALVEQIPEARRGAIEVVVLDVSR
uniref:Uncharacterized protein n=1 Tax=Caulobacter sp. (strain K31) TaxID=366602 RepID=B0T9H5_CAUSK